MIHVLLSMALAAYTCTSFLTMRVKKVSSSVHCMSLFGCRSRRDSGLEYHNGVGEGGEVIVVVVIVVVVIVAAVSDSVGERSMRERARDRATRPVQHAHAHRTHQLS